MSNFMAVATVTATLVDILTAAAAESGVSGAVATAVRPGTPKSDSGGLPDVGVNIFLYQISLNATWRNADLPNRRQDGTVVHRSQAALDLHYLLTFYGKEEDLEPQLVLGSVVRALQSRPMLTRKAIEAAKKAHAAVAGSDLEDAVDLVRLSPIPLSLEELSKLWSVFFQTPYVLSLAYMASVVLIEGKEKTQAALPVTGRNVYAVALCQPVIEKILSQKGAAQPILANQPILAGDTLVIAGRNLRGELTYVRLGKNVPVSVAAGDEQITLSLTAPPLAAESLRAGVQAVQVVHERNIGTPATPHRGVESNVMPFVLCPTVTAGAVSLGNSVVNGVTLCESDLTLDFVPPVGKKQRVVLLLNELNPPSETVRTAWAYHFDVPVTLPNPADTQTSQLKVRVQDVAAGEYLVRVQVDGAESPLDAGPDPAHPKYIKPKVTIS